jgi:Na+-translocating ferredoxin:NAD+ oxidoreductase RnfG subunit
MRMALKDLLLAVLACAATTTLAGAAGRVSAVEYATREALLSQQFHASERVTFRKFHLNPQERAQVEARLGRALPKSDYTFFVALTHGQPDGYALFDDQLGQHEPISFATFFYTAGRVTRVEIVAYREPFGDGVRAERFRKQFVGRSAKSQFRPGQDIDAIAGATISSRSLCVGVARGAVLLESALATLGATLGVQ